MGEVTIKDLTAANVRNQDILVGATVIRDLTNSNLTQVACRFPTAANMAPLGVVIDSTKLDSAGAVIAGQALSYRPWGVATAIASGAIAIGDTVGIANTSGQVATVTRAIAGAQPVPVLGIAQTAATNAGDPVEVLLTIGSTW